MVRPVQGNPFCGYRHRTVKCCLDGTNYITWIRSTHAHIELRFGFKFPWYLTLLQSMCHISSQIQWSHACIQELMLLSSGAWVEVIGQLPILYYRHATKSIPEHLLCFQVSLVMWKSVYMGKTSALMVQTIGTDNASCHFFTCGNSMPGQLA